jgi:hypothetical protein
MLRRVADEQIERSVLNRDVIAFRGRWTAPRDDLRTVLVPV